MSHIPNVGELQNRLSKEETHEKIVHLAKTITRVKTNPMFVKLYNPTFYCKIMQWNFHNNQRVSYKYERPIQGNAEFAAKVIFKFNVLCYPYFCNDLVQADMPDLEIIKNETIEMCPTCWNFKYETLRRTDGSYLTRERSDAWLKMFDTRFSTGGEDPHLCHRTHGGFLCQNLTRSWVIQEHSYASRR